MIFIGKVSDQRFQGNARNCTVAHPRSKENETKMIAGSMKLLRRMVSTVMSVKWYFKFLEQSFTVICDGIVVVELSSWNIVGYMLRGISQDRLTILMKLVTADKFADQDTTFTNFYAKGALLYGWSAWSMINAIFRTNIVPFISL